MAVNIVRYGNNTIMDISDSTVTPETLLNGVVAYNAAGERIVGTMVIDSVMSDVSENPVQNKAIKLYIDGHAQIHDDDIAAINSEIGDLEARLLALEGKALPAEYEQITALKAEGNLPYIDTRLTLDGSISVFIEGHTDTDSTGIFFDAYESSNKRMGGIFYNRQRPRYDRWWTGVNYGEHDTTGIDLSKKVLLQQTRTGVSVTQGSVTMATTYTGTTVTDTNIPIWLFKTRRTDLASNSVTIYSARFERNGEVLRNLIPVRRLADNELGMYDFVSKSFFSNAGSGTFTVGG